MHIRNKISALLLVALAPLPAAALATPPDDPTTPPNVLQQLQDTVTSIADRARPCVVSIEGAALAPPQTPNTQHPTPNTQRPTPNTQRPLAVVGTGFFVSGGYVVTSSEVAGRMRDPRVVTCDGQRLRIVSTNVDSVANVALLRVDGLTRVGLTWGDSDNVKPGWLAITIGNQSGFPNSVALALVAGTHRKGQSAAHTYDDLIQIQGSVGSGNSGGPLISARGELIGMIVAAPSGFARGVATNTPIGTGDGQNHRGNTASMDREQPDPIYLLTETSNTGFVLPSKTLKRIVAELTAKDDAIAKPGWLGIKIGDAPARQPAGALLYGIYADGPAERAGLLAGDLVVRCDGRPVASGQEMRAIARTLAVGQELTLEVLRDGVRHTLAVKAGVRPSSDVIEHTPVKELSSQTGDASVTTCHRG